MIITFFLSIFLDIKDRLKFVYLSNNIFDKRLPLKPRFDFNISLFINIYKDSKIQLILNFIDKNVLAKIV